jgi:hypothetical protein
MFQNMGPSPSGRSGHAMASMGHRVYVLGGESFSPSKTDDSGLVHVLDTSACTSAIASARPLKSLPLSEHIKYPSSKEAPPGAAPPVSQELSRKSSATPQGGAQQPPAASALANSTINGRSMSPSTVPNSDSEDPRRAMSPAGTQSIKPPNGVAQQPFPGTTNGKGKAPMRPRRDDDDFGTDDGTDAGTESYVRERTVSPDQGQSVRAKSPQFSVVSRAVSPANGDPFGGAQPNMVGAMSGINGVTGRSSPAVDRTKTPTDAFYGQPGSPAVNGFVRPGSRTGNGSVGNVTTDLIRDLKVKDMEMEAVKKQMGWMKEALAKASRSGYIYADRDGSPVHNEREDDEGRSAEIVLKFKQFKAQIQVGYNVTLLMRFIESFIDRDSGTSETGLRTGCGCGTSQNKCYAGGGLLPC